MPSFKILFVSKFSQLIIGILFLVIYAIVLVQIFVHLEKVTYFQEQGYPTWLFYLIFIFLGWPLYVGMRALEKKFIYPILFTKKERKLAADLTSNHLESKFRKIFGFFKKHR